MVGRLRKFCTKSSNFIYFEKFLSIPIPVLVIVILTNKLTLLGEPNLNIEDYWRRREHDYTAIRQHRGVKIGDFQLLYFYIRD